MKSVTSWLSYKNAKKECIQKHETPSPLNKQRNIAVEIAALRIKLSSDVHKMLLPQAKVVNFFQVLNTSSIIVQFIVKL